MALNTRKKRKKKDMSGSTFDSVLDEDGIREEVESTAVERVRAWQASRQKRKQRGTERVIPIFDARKKRVL